MTAAEPPERVTIRRAEQRDLHAVGRIERDVFPQPWPAEAFEQFLDEPAFLVAVTESSSGGGEDGGSAPVGDLVGYVVADVVSRFGTEVGHVKDLAVAREYRRRGVGAALLDRALAALGEQDVRRAKLEVREGNDAAQRLYDEFGFHLRRRLPNYYADGEDALVYVADVDA